VAVTVSRPFLVVTRPRPAAARLAAAARRAGFEPLLAPLLSIEPLPLAPLPVPLPDALLVTSARTPALARRAWGRTLEGLPAYAVGAATAAAVRRAGLRLAHSGRRDGSAALAAAAADGHARVLHLRGAEGAPLSIPPGVELVPLLLYRALPAERLPPPVVAALSGGRPALVPLFSPRSARIFAGLVDAAGLRRASFGLVALSPAIAEAAGPGWRAIRTCAHPTAVEAMAAARLLWQEDFRA